MKKAILLLLLLPILSSAQYFSKNIDINGQPNGLLAQIEVLVDDNDDIYTLSRDICSNGTETVDCVGISKSDKDGNLIWKKQIDSLFIRYKKCVILKDSLLYVLCKKNTFPIEDGFHVLKLDTNGDKIDFYDIDGTNTTSEPQEILAYQDGFMINYLHYTISSQKTARVAFYDQDFNYIRHTDYAYPQDYVYLRYSKSNIDQYGSIYTTNHYGYVEHQYLLITHIDPQGIVISQYSPIYNNSLPQVSCPPLILPNGNICTTWQKEWTGPFLQQDMSFTIETKDSLGNIIWEQDFSDVERSDWGTILDIFLTQEGAIVGLGSDFREYNGFEDEYSTGGWIFKLSATGELLWSRAIADFRNEAEAGRFSSGKELSNGDLVFAGQILTDTADDQWLVKTGPDGCLIDNCGTYQFIFPDTIYTFTKDIKDPRLDGFKIYPNPVHDQLHIDNPQRHKLPFNILNLLGQKVLTGTIKSQTNSVDIKGLKPGIYFIHLKGYKPTKIIIQ